MAENIENNPAVDWLDKLLPTVIELSIFGGSITFTVVVGTQAKDDQRLVTYLALAWLFFTLALGLASAAMMALSFNRREVVRCFQRNQANESERGLIVIDWPPNQWQRRLLKFTCFMFVGFSLSLVLQLLVMLAFLFLSLVVVAYSPAVGWVALGFTSSFIFVLTLSWIIHVCLT
ncbi:hypothetical protein BJ546DRAFT_1018937 [Cryomyces antarcticus]